MEVPRHPWRRYFARLLDISLYGLPFLAVELLWFHIPIKTFDRWWFQLLNSYLAYGVMLLAEPFLLHFWATTPGKAVFGITVRDAQGEKLSLHWARRRTFEVFAYGMGCGVPWYSLWKEYQALKAAREGEELTGYRYVLDTDTAYYRLDPAYQFYGTWAFFGSLPETSCFDLIPWQWEALLEEQALNFDFSYRGLRLTRRAEARGFGESWDNTAGLLVAPQGEKGHIYLEFTVTKE